VVLIAFCRKAVERIAAVLRRILMLPALKGDATVLEDELGVSAFQRSAGMICIPLGFCAFKGDARPVENDFALLAPDVDACPIEEVLRLHADDWLARVVDALGVVATLSVGAAFIVNAGIIEDVLAFSTSQQPAAVAGAEL
jgi:hypothetical protein